MDLPWDIYFNIHRTDTPQTQKQVGESWIEFDVVNTWIDYLRLSNDFSGFYKRSINAGTWKSTMTSRIQDVAFDGVTSNSIQDGGALVFNILIFDLRVQLQHCMYQEKTLLFDLIKVNTFICKREISGLSSPLRLLINLNSEMCEFDKPIFIWYTNARLWLEFIYDKDIYQIKICSLYFIYYSLESLSKWRSTHTKTPQTCYSLLNIQTWYMQVWYHSQVRI